MESFFYSVEYYIVAYLSDLWNEGKRGSLASFPNHFKRLANKSTTLCVQPGSRQVSIRKPSHREIP